MAIVSGGTFRNASLGEGHAPAPQGISLGGLTGNTTNATLVTTNFYNGDLQNGDLISGQLLMSVAQGALVGSGGTMNYQLNILLTTPASAYSANLYSYALSASGTQSQVYMLPFFAMRVNNSLYVSVNNIPTGTFGAGSVSAVTTNQFTTSQGGAIFQNVDFTQPNSLTLAMTTSGGDSTVVVNCLGANLARNVAS